MLWADTEGEGYNPGMDVYLRIPFKLSYASFPFARSAWLMEVRAWRRA